jgi:hypothetical protein
MPSLQLKPVDDRTRYTISQLIQLQMLRYARSLPRGSSERNERRQIAVSLAASLEISYGETLTPSRDRDKSRLGWRPHSGKPSIWSPRETSRGVDRVIMANEAAT